MPGPNYTIMPGDWTHLETIINDMSSRILTSPVDTSTIVSILTAISNYDISAVSAMASANSDLLSAVSNAVGGGVVDLSAVSNMASANSNAISILSNAVVTGDYDAAYRALVLEK